MSEISQEQAEEYMQVAGLMSQDLDLLLDLSKCRDITVEDLRWYIQDVIDKRDAAIKDPKGRRERYMICQALLNLMWSQKE